MEQRFLVMILGIVEQAAAGLAHEDAAEEAAARAAAQAEPELEPAVLAGLLELAAEPAALAEPAVVSVAA